MTASLYQTRASACGSAVSLAASSGKRSPDTEDVGRKDVRVQLDVVAPAVPFVRSIGKQIVDLKDFCRWKRNFNPSGLHVMRIEVHHHQDQVFTVLLRIRYELVVRQVVELQARVRM